MKKVLIFGLFFLPILTFGVCESIFSSGFVKGPAYSMFQQAVQARNNAYAPYSGFYVGVALLTVDSNIYCGCNVENAAYGSTQCAEANAVGNMITGGDKEVKSIVLVLESSFKDGEELVSTPCGNCRQILSEFGSEKTTVHIYTPDKGYKKTYTMKELLPGAFSLDQNKKKN